MSPFLLNIVTPVPMAWHCLEVGMCSNIIEPGSWHVLKHYLSVDGWVTLGISALEAESKLLEPGAVPTDCGLGQVNLSVSISPDWE